MVLFFKLVDMLFADFLEIVFAEARLFNKGANFFTANKVRQNNVAGAIIIKLRSLFRIIGLGNNYSFGILAL
jgi:hypothetical protein